MYNNVSLSTSAPHPQCACQNHTTLLLTAAGAAVMDCYMCQHTVLPCTSSWRQQVIPSLVACFSYFPENFAMAAPTSAGILLVALAAVCAPGCCQCDTPRDQ